MTNLSSRLSKEYLLWFPGIAADLFSDFASRNQVDPGLIEQYGTSRWLTRNSRLPVPNDGDIQVGPHVVKIEYLSSEIAGVEFNDLRFIDSRDPQVREQIQAAADIVNHIPSLSETIGTVAKSIHPIRAPRDHDVSHSTPDLPFSVFISVPDKDERDAALRVAESLIHEAMHLQLTLVDSIEPLVVDSRASAYSPWKGEVRAVTGLVHGLYVFAVIHQAFRRLIDLHSEWRPYCRKRRSAIVDEITSLPEAPQGLSKMGIDLWRHCLASISG